MSVEVNGQELAKPDAFRTHWYIYSEPFTEAENAGPSFKVVDKYGTFSRVPSAPIAEKLSADGVQRYRYKVNFIAPADKQLYLEAVNALAAHTNVRVVYRAYQNRANRPTPVPAATPTPPGATPTPVPDKEYPGSDASAVATVHREVALTGMIPDKPVVGETIAGIGVSIKNPEGANIQGTEEVVWSCTDPSVVLFAKSSDPTTFTSPLTANSTETVTLLIAKSASVQVSAQVGKDKLQQDLDAQPLKLSIDPAKIRIQVNDEQKLTLDGRDSQKVNLAKKAGVKVKWTKEEEDEQSPTLSDLTPNDAAETSTKALADGSAIVTAIATFDYKDAQGKIKTLQLGLAHAPITVRHAVGDIQLSGATTLVLGQSQTMTLRLEDETGKFLLDLEDRPIDVKASNPKILQVDQDKSDPRIITLRAVDVGDAEIVVTIGDELERTYQFKVVTISGFTPLEVQLNIMDETSASQLFGKQTSKDFYVMQVHLFNNLNKTNNPQFAGQALLAYSSTIEARVQLEKIYDSKSKSAIYRLDANGKPIPGKNGKPELVKPDDRTGTDSTYSLYKDESKYWQPVGEDEFVTNFTRTLSSPMNPFPDHHFLRNQKVEPTEVLTLKAPVPASGGAAAIPGEEFALHLMNGDEVSLDPNIRWEIVTNKPDLGTDRPIILDKNGTVHANANGVAVVKATLGGDIFYRFIKVIAPPIDPKKISHSNQVTSVTQVEVDGTLSLQLPDRFMTDTDGNKQNVSVMWENLNPNIISLTTVSGGDVTPPPPTTGMVTGKHPGLAVVQGVVTIDKGAAGREEHTVAIAVVVVPHDHQADLPPSVYEDKGTLKYLRHVFIYRPYKYDLMLNSLDPRYERDGRNQLFKALDFVGSVGSFLTATKAITGSGNRVLDIYGNQFLPNLRRLLPDMRDTERQNFVSMTMRPVEEIPYGASLEKVLFFPKQPFHGCIPGYLVRISGVDTSFFRTEVAVVDKRSSQQVEAVVR